MVLKYSLAWLALMAIAIANGTLREFTYGKYVSELAAHQISTLTGMIFTGLLVWLLYRIWPIQSAAQAWTIGPIWLALTILFEFGFGHFIAGHSWARLFADYNLTAGRIWVLFLFWILIMPSVIRKLAAG
jgi:hypothetical protein